MKYEQEAKMIYPETRFKERNEPVLNITELVFALDDQSIELLSRMLSEIILMINEGEVHFNEQEMRSFMILCLKHFRIFQRN